MNKFIDSHAHLTDQRYTGEYEGNIIMEVIESELLELIIDIGCDLESMDKTIELSKKYEKIYSAIGIHPVSYETYNAKVEEKITNLAKGNKKVVAIGEIGLDYYHLPEKKDEQKEVFKEQLALARKLKLPVIIHCREAYNDCYEILQDYSDLTIVIHSFASDYEDAKKFLDLGCYLGISGPLTFKNGQNQKSVVTQMPLERLIIETDSPYLTPVPYRGKINSPLYTEYVLKEVISLRSEEEKVIVDKLLENTKKIFSGLKND